MPCLIALAGLFFPRLVLAVLFLFTGYLGAAYQTVLWPVLGFILMPFTTLAYAVAMNSMGGMSGGGVVLVVIGVLLDLGSSGGAATAKRS
ncbi:MAG: hypothetical protein ACO3EP_03490 [Phycisphaerales bacterium]|jgi:hypothetical protein